MNRQDILRMGRQAGAFIELAQEKDLLWLERFAAHVVSAERERCAGLRKEVEMVGKHSADYEDGFWDALEKYENLIRAIMRDDDDDIQDYVRPWRGLTQEEKNSWVDAMPAYIQPWHLMNLVNFIEVKLKEKNHG